MCLIIDRKPLSLRAVLFYLTTLKSYITTPKKAKEDIEVYKFYSHYTEYTTGLVYSWYQNTEAFIGEETPKVEIEAILDLYTHEERWKVERGYHSFANLEDCKLHVMKQMSFQAQKSIRYVRCIIPKDSKYLQGKFIDYDNYVSETIKLIEFID